MCRPPTARQALGFSPLVKAGWTDASRIEGVPFTTAGTRPQFLLAGRPAAEWATDARRRRGGLLLFLNLAIQNDRFRGVGHNRSSSHAVDPRTDGCRCLMISTANHAPKTTSDAKQKPGHHCGAPAL